MSFSQRYISMFIFQTLLKELKFNVSIYGYFELLKTEKMSNFGFAKSLN